MLFLHDEKVFSLSKTVDHVPYSNITKLFGELFAYLIIAGLYDEARNTQGVLLDRGMISDHDFFIGKNGYSSGLGVMISKGLSERINVLYSHNDLDEQERVTLNRINSIFSDKNKSFVRLAGREFTNIAARREFDKDFATLAHYAAVMFGQEEFPATKKLQKLYISKFGNIHLFQNEMMEVKPPKLIYGTYCECRGQREEVTALYSLLSSQIDSICEGVFPGSDLGEYISALSFLTESLLPSAAISAPRFASALAVAGLMDIDNHQPIPVMQAAYKEFLYGSVRAGNSNIIILRYSILQYILDLMMEKVDTTTKGHLFSESSWYRKLFNVDSISIPTISTPVILDYALEALDAGVKNSDKSDEDIDTQEDEGDSTETDADDQDQDISEKGPTEDPQTDDGGFDPSVPPPAIPVGAPSMEKNTIGLISFDKTGEGIDEGLYRECVVALNDRIQRDDDVKVSADVKDALNYWVNGYLYRAAISATKEQITSLGLQKYLKNV